MNWSRFKPSDEQMRVFARAVLYGIGAWFFRHGWFHSEAEGQMWAGGAIYLGAFFWGFKSAVEPTVQIAAQRLVKAQKIEDKSVAPVIVVPNGGPVPYVKKVCPETAKAILKEGE